MGSLKFNKFGLGLGLGFVLGVIFTFLILVLTDSFDRTDYDPSDYQAVVANVDIDRGTLLLEELLIEKKFDNVVKLENNIRNLDYLVGQVANVDLKSGDIIENHMVIPRPPERSLCGPTVPDGTRALSLKISDLDFMSDLLVVGTTASVIIKVIDGSERGKSFILNKCEIIHMKGGVITLAITPKDAHLLLYASKAKEFVIQFQNEEYHDPSLLDLKDRAQMFDFMFKITNENNVSS